MKTVYRGTEKTNPFLCVEDLGQRVGGLSLCQQDMCVTKNTKTNKPTNIFWILHILLSLNILKSLKK